MNGVIAEAVILFQRPEGTLLLIKQIQAVAGGHPDPAFGVLQEVRDIIIAQAFFPGGVIGITGHLLPGLIQHLNARGRTEPEITDTIFHDRTNVGGRGCGKAAGRLEKSPRFPVHKVDPSKQGSHPKAPF
ncbi:hypothetical protein D9M69_506920 [compost metagenome]